MPQEDSGSTGASLKDKASEWMRRAEHVLEQTEMGEMERQIEQARCMELAYNCLQQAAVLGEIDIAALKLAGDYAAKWSTTMRGATTKRRNDEVPKLIEAMKDRRAWAQELLGIEEVD